MELRIFCQRGSCQNMLKTTRRLGYNIANVLYTHGWEKRDGLIICRECLAAETEKVFFQQKKTA
jgi:hypothetical protein